MLSNIGHRIISFFTICIAVFLSIISLSSTQRYGLETAGEIINGAPIYNDADCIIWHVIGIFILCMVCLITQKFQSDISDKLVYFLQIFFSFCGGVFALLLHLDGLVIPTGDQMQVYSAALYFNQGDFINLSPGGYVNMYPQQLGYIFFLQILFKVTGTNSFEFVQLINCFIIAGILLAMFVFLNDIIKNNSYRIWGSFFIMLSLPLYLLQSWVYGDLPFFLFTFLFLHQFFQCIQGLNRRNVAQLIIFAIFMLLFRKNALILLLAAFLTLIAQGIVANRKTYIVLGVAILLLPLLAWNGILLSYQHIAGVSDLRGLPSGCWIAMGMIEDASKPGWFNNYGVSTYYNNGCNYDKTSSDAINKIAERLQYFITSPIDAASFWKRKLCTQWNDPFFNTYDLIATEETVIGLRLFLTEHIAGTQVFLSVLQSLTYLGVLFYSLIRKHTSFLTRLPEVMLLGGFFFSLLWEANSRYVYPYYLIVLPAALLGWELFTTRLYDKIRKGTKNDKT